jgi:flagellar basal body rod protein FlgG
MIRALYTAASGMSAQQANLDTVANNLANSATSGFRSRKMQFEDMIYQNLVAPGSAASTSTTAAGLQIGLGTKSTATSPRRGTSLIWRSRGRDSFRCSCRTGRSPTRATGTSA